MTAIAQGARRNQTTSLWFGIGVALLAYAVLGNWLVLPGYRRFLAHEGGGADGLALVWGAARTILWMLSFHLGALCLALAALNGRESVSRGFRRGFLAAGLAWIAVWAIPTLPGPYTVFFAATGVLIAGAIVAVFAGAARGGTATESWRVASLFFFALATWDVCGLGSVGGILDPAGDIRAASQPLVVAQTTKLIVELAFAWGLLAISALSPRSVR